MDGMKNEIGETLAFCELWDEWKNVTLGDCFGNCESQEEYVDGMDIIKDIARLQKNYDNLVSNKKLTKKAMCDLVIPFRDEYWLTDKEALMIARSEINIDEIVRILENSFNRREKEIESVKSFIGKINN
jgi:hypothetical protein